ncbi:DUF1569 domain-containing protein [Mucilaginibacter sp. UYNi724]
MAKRVSGEAFFSAKTYRRFEGRLIRLNPSSHSNWGKMDAAQMLHHLNLSMGSGQGYYFLPDESNFLSRSLIKWIVIDLYSEQPKGLELPIGMAVSHENYCNFDFEKTRFLEILDKAVSSTASKQWQPHCYFGILSASEWGKLCLIHIDYHLKQFNC